MCTAISLNTKDHYFGRNLDLEYSYKETVTITPRNYPLPFRKKNTLTTHYAIIGMAYVFENYPLYYDATNEKGLSMAGLNFPDNAFYPDKAIESLDNISPFELIPWILGQCATIEESLQLLTRIHLLAIPVHKSLPLTPLHWMISDANRSIIAEPLADGIHIHENPLGVLTNNPPFDFQLMYLNQFMNLSKKPAVNHFSSKLPLAAYSRGMGALGLPGDFSSSSRFVRAAFVKTNSICEASENSSVHQFFHILDCVQQPRGSVELEPEVYEITYYTSCCNTSKGIYYYKTYDNSQITAVHMHKENLDSEALISYPLRKKNAIFHENQ